jgi:hypothetical protein
MVLEGHGVYAHSVGVASSHPGTRPACSIHSEGEPNGARSRTTGGRKIVEASQIHDALTMYLNLGLIEFPGS